MAIFQSTGVFGYLCSALRTGKLDEKGRPIYTENFLSGFAGWGWKIWKTVAGFFRLEIDELVVRRTMTVFELLIQKIRAVKGAMAITQANGKIKSVELSADETFYLLTLEEEDMSFVEYDFIRCQEFTASQRFYHVEVASVSEGIIRIPASEFEGSSIPLVGDEIVQFGNSSHDEQYAGRHSAIYLHADESGQPAIDVMFGIKSKDWTGCVKTRVGGDIPGSGGLKGFYCENGMIKGVDSAGHTVYCIYPDGSAMFGDGSAMFNTDKSGYIAGGAIAWEWNAEKKKYVCTMKDVVLTWDNLDDEAKENLKGEPGRDGVPGNPGVDGKVLFTWIRYADTSAGGGISNNPTGKLYIGFAYNKEIAAESNTPSDYTWSLFRGTDGKPGTDANLLPWIEKWNGYATELGEEYIVTPKMFSGTKNPDTGKLTGIAQGKDCITIDGKKRTGIFALVDNEVVFELDPVTKKYLFKGHVEADSGVIGGFKIDGYGLGNDGNRDSSITIDVVNGSEQRIAALGNRIPASAGIDSAAYFRAKGSGENRALVVNSSGSTMNYGIFGGKANLAMDIHGGVNWKPASDDHWCMPGFLWGAEINGTSLEITTSWGNGISPYKIDRNSDQSLTIIHNIGHRHYYALVTPYAQLNDGTWHSVTSMYLSKNDNNVTFYFRAEGNNVITPMYFTVAFFGRPATNV